MSNGHVKLKNVYVGCVFIGYDYCKNYQKGNLPFPIDQDVT